MHELELEAGQKVTVDTGHLVAFTEDIRYEVRRVGGWKSTLFSGEGLVVDLTGPGRVIACGPTCVQGLRSGAGGGPLGHVSGHAGATSGPQKADRP